MTFPNINVPAGDQSLTVFPVTNPGTTLASMSVVGTTAAAGSREFLVNFGLNATNGSSGPAGNDKVTLFSGINGTAGTSDIWSMNTSCTMAAGSGSYNAQGYELDFNNLVGNRGNSGSINSDFSAPVAYGLAITGAGTATSTSAILISSQAPGGSPPQWARGISTFGQMTICAFQEFTTAPIAMQFDGSYSVAALNMTSVYGNPGARTQTALFMKNNQGVSWQNAAGNNAITDVSDGGNNRLVGVGSAGVYTGASCMPLAAGFNLGSPSNYWGIVYSTGGVVNPSDIALKKEIAPLPPMSQVIRDIDPIAFKFRDGDDRLHYGFDAQTIRDHFPADFAGHVVAGGVQHLAKDQLISVLWKSNQEMQTRLDQLEARLNTPLTQ